jgi:hypothetical protein
MDMHQTHAQNPIGPYIDFSHVAAKTQQTDGTKRRCPGHSAFSSSLASHNWRASLLRNTKLFGTIFVGMLG